MSNTAQYKITPSDIDAASNVNILPDYVFTVTNDSECEHKLTVADSVTAKLRYLSTCYFYELTSDYPVTLVCGGLTYTGVRNVILNLGTQLAVASTPTVHNVSGSTATVTWRMIDHA